MWWFRGQNTTNNKFLVSEDACRDGIITRSVQGCPQVDTEQCLIVVQYNFAAYNVIASM